MKRIHRHRQSLRSRLLAALPAATFAGILLALGFATGEIPAYARGLRRLFEAAPLPEPGPNGWPVAVVVISVVGCWWRMGKAVTTPHEFDELAPRRKPPRGTELLMPGDPARPVVLRVERRRLHPPVPFADLHPDPEEVRPTLLPVHANGEFADEQH